MKRRWASSGDFKAVLHRAQLQLAAAVIAA
jgi:hypothetical protein